MWQILVSRLIQAVWLDGASYMTSLQGTLILPQLAQ